MVALGREAVAQEAAALGELAGALDASFAAAVRALLASSGRVMVTGLGKSGFVARKLAATLTSTGTPSQFVHPVEAAHGDLGVP
ncbi:SIS domain-containing protein, partial [bacterium]|nr:SIS domain-containing protein [bacterium]